MSFGISGFGGQQLTASPQVFQSLSLGGARPVPPAPPYGTPNPNLVAVTSTGNPALPANLTLAAHPAFTAILNVTGQSVLQFGHPSLPAASYTTTSIAATNPRVSGQLQGPPPAGIPTIGTPPDGPVSFSLTAAPASLTSGLDALTQSLANLKPPSLAPVSATATAAQSVPGTPAPAPTAHSGNASTGSIPAAASPGAVAKIVQTVHAIAVAAVYSAPVFSFKA